FYINERMDRLRFAYRSSDAAFDYYRVRDRIGLRLKRARGQTDAPWILEDGTGIASVFDGGSGNLASVVDQAGHALNVQWIKNTVDSAWKVSSVTDTTGRTIHYVYHPQTLKIVDPSGRARSETFDSLQCLSLTTNCKRPLVSFQTRGIVALGRLAD